MDKVSAANAEPLPDFHRQAIGLEKFSIGWMLIEAGVAVTAGIVAGSLALTSFGFDSVIELVSASLVLRSLRLLHLIDAKNTKAEVKSPARLHRCSYPSSGRSVQTRCNGISACTSAGRRL